MTKKTKKETVNTEDSQETIVEEGQNSESTSATPEDTNAGISKDQYDELNNKYLRIYSEFENFKKRSVKERIDLISTASEDVIKKFLPVLDDFERAIQINQTSDDVSAIKEGFALMQQKVKSILQQKGVKEMEAQHTTFDSDLHEALTKIPVSDEKLKGKVVEVVEKGYYLGDKIVRYAKVVVGE